jgi:ABC-type transport system substrate-binding protein
LQYTALPGASLTGFLAFNSTHPPFSDPDVRRAAALAIDRERLAELWRHVPTSQLLPPMMPGSEEPDVYPLDGSGLEEAPSLMHGRTFDAFMVIDEGNDRDRLFAEAVRSSLAPIGINVEFDGFPVLGNPYMRGTEVDLMSTSAELWYPDPATFLYDMLLDRMPDWWLPEGVARELEELARMTDAERRSTAAALAARLAIDEVPVAAIWSAAVPTLLSPNLGCRVFPPFGYESTSLHSVQTRMHESPPG